MFPKLPRATGLAAAMLISLSASAALAGQAQQTSSPVWWSAAGDHADLVLRYDVNATVPLTVRSFFILDAGGYGIASQLNSCGMPIKTGDTVTAYQLNPGQICYLRAYRGSQQDEVAGKAIVSDSTKDTTNIQQFVHTSVEIRDASDNTLTHVEVY